MLIRSLLLLCHLTLFAFSTEYFEYVDEHEYSYDYDGQISSTLSDGKNYAVIRFQAVVKLSFITDTNVIIHLQNVKVGRWNDYFDSPQKMANFSLFENIVIKDEYFSKLSLPFQIRYNNGKVFGVKFQNNDTEFSENIKRGIANILQVQHPSVINTENFVDESFAFRINETSVEGLCETLYSGWKNQIFSNNLSSYNLMKTIDFSRCNHRPELRYNYFRFSQLERKHWKNGEKKLAESYLYNSPALTMSSVYEFDLNGNDKHYLIKNAKIFSTYNYDIVDTQHASLITYAFSNLAFKSMKPKETSTPEYDFKEADSIIFSNNLNKLYEDFIADGDESLFIENPQIKISKSSFIIIKCLNKLHKAETLNDRTTSIINELVSLLRHSSKNDINHIFQSILDEHDNKEVKLEIFADILLMSGTNNTIDKIFEMIKNENINEIKSSLILSKLINLQFISYEVVINLKQLCYHHWIQETTNLKRVCMLSYGALVNSLCKQEASFRKADKYTSVGDCGYFFKKDVVEGMINFYNKSSNHEEKILALKTIGNIALKKFIPFLRDVIYNDKTEIIFRIIAIEALRHMEMEMPNKIQHILLPIFQNRNESPEIRVHAMNQLLDTHPDKALVFMIIGDILNEPSDVVKSSFCHMIHQKIMNNKYNKETTKLFRNLLNDFGFNATGMSNNFFTNLPFNFGLTNISNHNSFLPKEIIASFNIFLNNHYIPSFIQFGFLFQNIEKLISKSDPTNFCKFIKSLLKQNAASDVSNNGKPMILFYFRDQGIDSYYYVIDEQSFSEISQFFTGDNLLKMQKNIKFNWISYLYDQQINIPTVFGLPLHTSLSAPMFSVLNGNVTTHLSEAAISFHGQIKTIIAAGLEMKIFSPFINIGTKTYYSAQTYFPLKLQTKPDSTSCLPNITIEIPNEDVELLLLQSRPSTFTEIWTEANEKEMDEKTLFMEGKKYVTDEKVFNSSSFGLPTQIFSQFDSDSTSLSDGVFDNGYLTGNNWFQMKSNRLMQKFEIGLNGSSSINGNNTFFTPENLLLEVETHDFINRLGIFGGHNAHEKIYIFTVNVQLKENHICGGALVTTKFILCAAHCLKGLDKNDVSVLVGGYKVKDGVRYQAADIKVHPKYDKVAYNGYDIGYILLDTEVNLNHPKYPAGLINVPTRPLDVRTEATVLGWGASSGIKPNYNYPKNLLKHELPILPFSDCKKVVKNLRDSMLCAGWVTGGHTINVCDADSGGPLVHHNGVEFQLFGLVSFGNDNCNAMDYPSVFVNITYWEIREWIKEKIDISSKLFMQRVSLPLLSSPKIQNFSIPENIIFYISKNPSTIKVYEKLIKICKYFYLKAQIITFNYLITIGPVDCWRVRQLNGIDTSLEIMFQIQNFRGKIWINDEFEIRFQPGKSVASSIAQKIYRCDIRVLYLTDQIITFNEFKLFISSGLVESLTIRDNSVVKSDDENGKTVPIETLIEMLPKLKLFACSNTIIDPWPMTSKTAEKLPNIRHFENLERFALSYLPEMFDFETFFDKLKKPCKISISLRFNNFISNNFKERLKAFVDKTIEDGLTDNYPPDIDYPEMTEESKQALWELMDEYDK